MLHRIERSRKKVDRLWREQLAVKSAISKSKREQRPLTIDLEWVCEEAGATFDETGLENLFDEDNEDHQRILRNVQKAFSVMHHQFRDSLMANANLPWEEHK